ncbi:hypothetical protein [Verrucosispora sp. WMMD1129]|uniref:hypothetical protein n=1 Tax=Verrucosispora sp. WMMD1129 TaxID=3016093 RepID=UPI002499BBA8|nr:hypothetical protein [Verrucosispora sp. WMMD1129]WFE44259.1 hypothetical protein O7624_07885 [Verrucosispora sp. WMMD1129]
MSRPDRWWRPEATRRPGGGARRRANVRRQTNAAYDSGYAAGYVDGLERTRARDEQITRLARAADAAENGDYTLLDEIARENGLPEPGVASLAEVDGAQLVAGLENWLAEQNGDDR